MNFDLKKPCANCPLLVSEDRVNLRAARIREIHGYLTGSQGGSFPCHKTASRDDEDGYVPSPGEQYCAGGLIYALAQRSPNQLTRIAMRLGEIDPNELLKHRDLVFSSLHQWLKRAVDYEDYEREREEIEACSIVNNGCHAPAGYMGANGVEDGTESAEFKCYECGDPVCGNPSCSSVLEGKRLCGACWEWRS